MEARKPFTLPIPLGSLAWLLVAVAIGAPAAAQDLRVSFATSSAGGKYKPRNVLALWIEDDQGRFVATIGLWAKRRAHDLSEWCAATDNRNRDVDARTGATQLAYGLHKVTWDLKGRDGKEVPDGLYRIRLEMADDNAEKGKFNRATFTFDKNGAPSAQKLPDQNGFSQIAIEYLADGAGAMAGAAGDASFASASGASLQSNQIQPPTPAARAAAGDNAATLPPRTPPSPEGAPCALALRGAQALVAQGDWFLILDTTEPRELKLLGRARLPGPLSALAVAGSTAYGAAGALGVVPIDLTNPAAPAPLGAFDTPGHAWDVALEGALLCVADGSGGLRLYDLNEPTRPAPLGVYGGEGPIRAVAAAGETAFVLDEHAGFQAVSLVDPPKPTALGSPAAIELGRALAIGRDVAFATDRVGNFFSIDLANPAAPILGQTARLPQPGRAIALGDAKAFVALGTSGFETLDVTETSATLASAPPGPLGAAHALACADGTLWILDAAGGLRAVELDR